MLAFQGGKKKKVLWFLFIQIGNKFPCVLLKILFDILNIVSCLPVVYCLWYMKGVDNS